MIWCDSSENLKSDPPPPVTERKPVLDSFPHKLALVKLAKQYIDQAVLNLTTEIGAAVYRNSVLMDI